MQVFYTPLPPASPLMKGRTLQTCIFFTRLITLFSFSAVDFICHPVNIFLLSTLIHPVSQVTPGVLVFIG